MNGADVCIFFQIIKDFYLLGRGELYQVFIDLAQHMLKTPPTAVTEHGTFLNLWSSFPLVNSSLTVVTH